MTKEESIQTIKHSITELYWVMSQIDNICDVERELQSAIYELERVLTYLEHDNKEIY